jgi:uncharacterized protein (TIGR02611 family)
MRREVGYGTAGDRRDGGRSAADESSADQRIDEAIDVVVDDVAEVAGEPGWRGIPHRIRATPGGRLALKIIVGLVGTVVIALGIFLIPLPGPGWLIVLAGLAILASEFDWAHRLLQFTRARLEAWWHWIGRQSWPVRLAVGAAGLAFVAAVVWLSLLVSFDLNLVTWVLAQR